MINERSRTVLLERAGAEVSVLHRGERPLEGFDPDLVAQLVQLGYRAVIVAVGTCPTLGEAANERTLKMS